MFAIFETQDMPIRIQLPLTINYSDFMLKYVCVLLGSLLFVASCGNTKEFTGYSYDPPNVTDTRDKEIQIQNHRVIGVDSPRVWISNEFAGARVNDVFLSDDSSIVIQVEPENFPINNSPWYAFKVWSDTVRSASIQMQYKEGRHRYVPKLLYRSARSSIWKEEMKIPAEIDSSTGIARIEVMLAEEPIILSGQPLYTYKGLMDTLRNRSITGHEYTSLSEIGKSHHGRSIWKLEINEVNPTPDKPVPVLVLVGRQHPPEVTGYQASLIFLEEITSDNDLAQRFRDTFEVQAFPMLNPDGVDMGHWRHNAAGIDLNRDWKNFNQPETQAVRQALLPYKENENKKMFYAIDFHSTNENIFYPINREIETDPDNFTQAWVEKINSDNPDLAFNIEEFEPSSPIAKNWFYRTFGIDAVTYEVDDQMPAEELEEVSRSAARSLMKMLLNAYSDEKSAD